MGNPLGGILGVHFGHGPTSRKHGYKIAVLSLCVAQMTHENN
jgi:hypothetical protein